MRGAWVYIMSNRRNGTLYVGVTNNLSRRVWEHKEGNVEGFTKEYGVKLLVYYESYRDVRDPFSARRISRSGRAAGRST